MSMLSVLQENILTLLSVDEQRAKIIRNTVEPEVFGGLYRTIAARIYDFIDKHGKPPGDHLPDILFDKLESKGRREAKMYEDIILSIHQAKDGINAEYVMSQLEQFVRRQSLRTVAIDLSKALQRDTEESLDEADQLIRSANTTSLKVFDAGIRLNDPKKALKFLDPTEAAFPTGIKELDKRGFGPTRKELWMAIADTKKGKTWLLTHLAKIAVMSRLKVCHITLEMSDSKVSQRYFQAFFSISKRKETFRNVKFVRDARGRITDFQDITVTPRLNFSDPDIDSKLTKLQAKWSQRLLKNIFIKQFPTGTLTIQQLDGYLDNLEMQEHFTPDLLVLDYPDLMESDPSNLRNSLDDIYKTLRGLAIRRNIALATVSQGNRKGAEAKTMKGIHIGEDYRKLQHCDCAVTYSQTEHEERLGLARLNVVAGRNDERIEMIISQRYATGAFVIDSNLKVGKYWELIGHENTQEGDDK